MVMMLLGTESFSVSTFAALQKSSHSCDGRCARSGIFRDLSVGFSFLYLLCHLEALTPSLQFCQRSDVPQEISNFCLRFTGSQSFA